MSRADGKLRKGEITTKDMAVLREADNAYQQHKQNTSVLRDYGLQHRVTMKWDMSPESTRDRMFILNVGGNEVILDYEEFLRSGRWI